MNIWEAYKELELLAHVHGWETPLLGGGVEGGDPVNVWFSDDYEPCIYIG